MGEEIFQVDTFTDRLFSGNPAAVCLLACARDEGWMQCVAAEMNLSETAFVLQFEEEYSLRWFTPSAEVDLCGHATLASAHVLWESGLLSHERPAVFHTRSGKLKAVRRGGLIELDFPSEAPEETTLPEALTRALGITHKYVGKNRFDYLIEVESEDVLRNIKPDFSILKTLPVRGVIVTSISASEEYDFISRFFAPSVSINEDPVTGSAHCCLGPYWGRRLGKKEFIAFQASQRGGIVLVRLEGDRVHLGGKAVTVMRGILL